MEGGGAAFTDGAAGPSTEIIATQRDKAMQRLSDPLSGISARRPGNRRQAFVNKRLSTEEWSPFYA